MNNEIEEIVSTIIKQNSFDILKYYKDNEIMKVLNYLGSIKRYNLLLSYLGEDNNKFSKLVVDIIENSYNGFYIYLIGVYGYDLDYDKLTRMIIKAGDILYMQKFLDLDIGVFNKMAIVECVLQNGDMTVSKKEATSCLFNNYEEYLDKALTEGLIDSLNRIKLSRATIKYLLLMNKDKYNDALNIYSSFLESKDDYNNYLLLDDIYRAKLGMKIRKKELN